MENTVRGTAPDVCGIDLSVTYAEDICARSFDLPLTAVVARNHPVGEQCGLKVGDCGVRWGKVEEGSTSS